MSIPRFWRNIGSRYNLLGTRCANCGTAYFPPRNFCPKCRRASKIEKHKFRGTGEVETYTIIHVAPEGFDAQTPYVMAIVRLDEGPRLTAQIVNCDGSEIKIGMRVESVFRRITEDGNAGLIHYGYKFQPAVQEEKR